MLPPGAAAKMGETEHRAGEMLSRVSFLGHTR